MRTASSRMSRTPAYWQHKARPGEVYAVLFPNGGEVALDLSEVAGGQILHMQWLDIKTSSWRAPQTVQAATALNLQAPGGGFWAVLVRALR